MKHLVVLVLAVIAIVAIRIFKNFKKQILITFLSCITLFSAFITFKDINGLVDFIRPFNQFFYQPEYLESGMYPDAILPLMVRGKTVYMKDDIWVPDFASEDPQIELSIDKVNRGINTENLMKAFDCNVIRDASFNDIVLSDEIKSEFGDLGYANDMLRSSGAVGFYDHKYGNYFHHYFVYSAYGAPLHIYLHDDTDCLVNDTDAELVVFSDYLNSFPFGENIYIMDKNYFDNKVKPLSTE